MSHFTSQDCGEAFGRPGIPPKWTSSPKEGVGTAYSTSSRVWFTLSHGILRVPGENWAHTALDNMRLHRTAGAQHMPRPPRAAAAGEPHVVSLSGELIVGKQKDSIQALFKPIYRESSGSTTIHLTDSRFRRNCRSTSRILCENLRSILDYIAHDVREALCASADPKARFYFPILPSRQEFEE